MQYIVPVADKQGLEFYLRSQMVAHKIYRRLGWEDLDHFDTGLSLWDSEEKLGFHKVICMLRLPTPLRRVGFSHNEDCSSWWKLICCVSHLIRTYVPPHFTGKNVRLCVK